MCFFNTKQIFLIIFLLFLFFCHHPQLISFIKRAIIQNCINRHLDTLLYNYYSFLFFYLPTAPLIPQIIWQISFWCLILHRLSFQDICKHNSKRLPHGVKAVKKMEEKILAIVLNTVKHSDRHNIMSVYTPTHGRISFIVSAAGSKATRIRNARLQPLSIVELTARIKNGKELHSFTQVSPVVVYRDLYYNPIKNVLGIFIAEFLNRLLRDTIADRKMWTFIADSLQLLDRLPNGIANFHIVFLHSMATFCGISPDISNYDENHFFDMQAGTYTSKLPAHKAYIGGEEAKIPVILERMNYTNMHLWKFSRNERNRIIEGILNYYEIHIPGMAKMRSLDVLRQIFD